MFTTASPFKGSAEVVSVAAESFSSFSLAKELSEREKLIREKNIDIIKIFLSKIITNFSRLSLLKYTQTENAI